MLKRLWEGAEYADVELMHEVRDRVEVGRLPRDIDCDICGNNCLLVVYQCTPPPLPQRPGNIHV